MNIVHSLWVSKLRYGLQLCVRVLLNEEERKSKALKTLQLTQNRLLRALNGTKIKDRVTTSSMLEKFGLISVNQLAAQIKLTEVWKSKNVENYAISLDPYRQPQKDGDLEHRLRPRTTRIFDDSARLVVSKQSFSIDAARIWNQAPAEVKLAPTLEAAKREILTHVKSLPV